MKEKPGQCEDTQAGAGERSPPNIRCRHPLPPFAVDVTNLDEVLVDPLGEGFLLHTVPLI
jgi:hypothetical protein